MNKKLVEWIDTTSTKEKEQALRQYLSEQGSLDKESERIIDIMLFDDNNIPFVDPDIKMVFEELVIDKDDFLEFIEFEY